MKFLLYFGTLFQLAALIVMISEGAIHSNRYTYWNFTLSTLFLLFLSFSYWYIKKDYGLRFFEILTLFFLPSVFGSVCFVLVYIIIVLQMDDGWQLLAATILGGGSLTLGSVHTFDWIIHTGPLVILLVIMWAVYGNDANACIQTFIEALPRKLNKWQFLPYYYVAPLFPITIYMIFFNPVEQYPTSAPLLTLGLGIISYFIIMTLLFLILTEKPDTSVISKLRKENPLGTFFSINK